MSENKNMSIKESQDNIKIEFEGEFSFPSTLVDNGIQLYSSIGDLTSFGNTIQQAFNIMMQKLTIFALESYWKGGLETDFAKQGWRVHVENDRKLLILSSPSKIEVDLGNETIIDDDLEIVDTWSSVDDMKNFALKNGLINSIEEINSFMNNVQIKSI